MSNLHKTMPILLISLILLSACSPNRTETGPKPVASAVPAASTAPTASTAGEITANDIQNEDKITLNKETEHFLFYCSSTEVDRLDSFSSDLEKGYERISRDLNYQDRDRKLNVYIYPDLQSYHNAIGQPDAPGWMIGSCIGGEFYFVSPAIMHLPPKNVADHELAHYVTEQVGDTGGMQQWLYQGIAVYEMFDVNEFNTFYKPTVDTVVLGGAIPSLGDLYSYGDFSEKSGYELSYTIIDYLIKNYGMDKVRELLNNPFDIKGVLGLSEEELSREWARYLIDNCG